MTRMTGANMKLVTVNVKLGENDPEPEPKLEPVGVYSSLIGWDIGLRSFRENISSRGSYRSKICIVSYKVISRIKDSGFG
jgi:hypothetical protein